MEAKKISPPLSPQEGLLLRLQFLQFTIPQLYGAPLGAKRARGSPLSFPRCPALLQSPPFIPVTIIPCANAYLTLQSCEGIFQCLHSEGWPTRRSFTLECWCKHCCASNCLNVKPFHSKDIQLREGTQRRQTHVYVEGEFLVIWTVISVILLIISVFLAIL